MKEKPTQNRETLEKRESARALIRDGNDVLLVRRTRITNGKVRTYYVLPGGGIEPEEEVEGALERELQEEISSNPVIGDKLLEIRSQDKDTLTVQHIYECTIPSRNVTLSGPEALRNTKDNRYELQWISLKKAAHLNIVPDEVKQLILNLQ